MKARTFISLMLLLLVLTSVLLAFTPQAKPAAAASDCPSSTSCSEDAEVQAGDGNFIWESVSRHLISVVQ